MVHKKTIVGIILICLLILSVVVGFLMFYLDSSSAVVRSSQEFFCEIKGGNFSCGEGCYCVRATKDAGQACTDSDQCEGWCLAVRNTTQTTSSTTKGTISVLGGGMMPAPIDATQYQAVGQCADTTDQLGAAVILENGVAQSVYYVD